MGCHLDIYFCLPEAYYTSGCNLLSNADSCESLLSSGQGTLSILRKIWALVKKESMSANIACQYKPKSLQIAASEGDCVKIAGTIHHRQLGCKSSSSSRPWRSCRGS